MKLLNRNSFAADSWIARFLPLVTCAGFSRITGFEVEGEGSHWIFKKLTFLVAVTPISNGHSIWEWNSLYLHLRIFHLSKNLYHVHPFKPANPLNPAQTSSKKKLENEKNPAMIYALTSVTCNLYHPRLYYHILPAMGWYVYIQMGGTLQDNVYEHIFWAIFPPSTPPRSHLHWFYLAQLPVASAPPSVAPVLRWSSEQALLPGPRPWSAPGPWELRRQRVWA